MITSLTSHAIGVSPCSASALRLDHFSEPLGYARSSPEGPRQRLQVRAINSNSAPLANMAGQAAPLLHQGFDNLDVDKVIERPINRPPLRLSPPPGAP